MSGQSPLVVHISADYPDAFRPNKTRAISALVEGSTGQLRHRVYSLNRDGGPRAWLHPGDIEVVSDDDVVATWRYAGPGGGICLKTAMRRVAEFVLEDLHRRKLRPALIHGHKLSFEGIAAEHVAKAMQLPYALTLQGNTDQKVIGLRPDLAAAYGRIWRNAEIVFALAPWIARYCDEKLGRRSALTVSLPCVPVRDDLLAPIRTPPLVVSAFNLDDWRNKNVSGLIKACVQLRVSFPALELEIAGGGSPSSQRSVQRLITKAGAENFIRLAGRIEPEHIQRWMNGAAVFAMPSRRESFGMVFPEALLAGCPIIYPLGAAVDGYFGQLTFTRGVNPNSTTSIAQGIADLLHNSGDIKSALARWQSMGYAEAFRAKSVVRQYAETTLSALA